MFPRAEVKGELAKFIRVRLYTDGSGSLYENQQKMESDRFGTVALPLYVILSPEDRSVATFSGLTRSPKEFLAFLAKYQRGA